jgi:DNA-binding transcriptional LysR family regulator
MNRLESMSILVAAAKAGSLSAAGRSLGMPLATVSRKVSALEAHLKTRLLIRSSRKLGLTEAGRAYVAACARILEEVDEAERAARGEFTAPKGELVVTAPIVFGRLHVLPVALDFLAAYPEIDMRITFADRNINLLEERVDVALRIGELPDSSLVASRVGSIRRVVAASPAYFAARGTPKKPADLAGHDCIAFEGMNSATSWVFRSGRRPVPVAIHARLVINTAEAAIDAAVAGLGITRVLAYQAVGSLRAATLILALEKFEPAPLPVHLVHGGGLLPLKLRAFLDYAAPRLKARISQSEAAFPGGFRSPA